MDVETQRTSGRLYAYVRLRSSPCERTNSNDVYAYKKDNRQADPRQTDPIVLFTSMLEVHYEQVLFIFILRLDELRIATNT